MLKGYKHSKEAKKKMRMVKLGVKRPPFSEEHKRKIKQANTGYKHTGEAKEKMSKWQIGRLPWNKGIKSNIPRENHYNWKGGLPKCKECNKELKNRYAKHCVKHRKQFGENSPSWKGGITPINEKIRKSLEYKLWRESVFKRDNYTCVWCFIKNGNGKTVILHADHIKPFSSYPALRFAIDNGRTLCIDCHKKTNTYGRPNNDKKKY